MASSGTRTLDGAVLPAVEPIPVSFEGLEGFSFYSSRCHEAPTHFRVTEESTGCAIGYEYGRSREEAIRLASEYLLKHGPDALRRAIERWNSGTDR